MNVGVRCLWTAVRIVSQTERIWREERSPLLPCGHERRDRVDGLVLLLVGRDGGIGIPELPAVVPELRVVAVLNHGDAVLVAGFGLEVEAEGAIDGERVRGG